MLHHQSASAHWRANQICQENSYRCLVAPFVVSSPPTSTHYQSSVFALETCISLHLARNRTRCSSNQSLCIDPCTLAKHPMVPKFYRCWIDCWAHRSSHFVIIDAHFPAGQTHKSSPEIHRSFNCGSVQLQTNYRSVRARSCISQSRANRPSCTLILSCFIKSRVIRSGSLPLQNPQPVHRSLQPPKSAFDSYHRTNHRQGSAWISIGEVAEHYNNEKRETLAARKEAALSRVQFVRYVEAM